MDKELEKYLNKLGWKSLYSTTLTLVGIGAFFTFLISLIERPIKISALIIFLICAVSVYYMNEINLKKYNGLSFPPVVLQSQNILSFEYIQEKLLSLTCSNDTFIYENDVIFYKISSNLKIRAILYKTDNFSKTTFDKIKKKVNKKANSIYHSHISNRNHGYKHIHFNIIYTDNYNDQISILISNSALFGLNRIDGAINILVCNNQIIVPPLYGNCDFPEIRRYKKIIKFILERILQ